MIVFIAGMMRSGSTFTFNVVRELLSSRGQVCTEASGKVMDVARRAGPADHVIVKGHGANPETLELVRSGKLPTICTWRKPVDAFASWIDTFGFTYNQASREYHQWLKMFALIRNHSLLIFYDDIEQHRTECVRRIANHILDGVSETEISLISEKCSKANAKAVADRVTSGHENAVDIGFSRYDPVTFLHRRHVSSLEVQTAEGRIPDAMIARIRRDFARYIDDNGNLRLDF